MTPKKVAKKAAKKGKKKAAPQSKSNIARDKAVARAKKFAKEQLADPKAAEKRKKTAAQHYRVVLMCPGEEDILTTVVAEDVTKNRKGELKLKCPRCDKKVEVMPNFVSLTDPDNNDHQLRQVQELKTND